ncbi:MAG: histidine phosphatase family protein, partial [Clostridiales bacterium]|nr:histidine phosphatase family protein [Clostridiales bacterium]
MTKIYLIRHAEAEGNLYRRVHGHYDGDITPRGYRQIALLAERFRDIKIDALYASDLQRTQKTAAAIMKYHDIPLNIEPRLKEVCMGVWEDLPWGNIGYYEPEQLLKFSNDPKSWNIKGGEDFDHLKARIKSAVLEIAEKHEGQTIACFSHGMAIRALVSEIKGIPSERIHEISHGDNTCVSLLACHDGKLEIEYYNDNSHLPPEISTFANQGWWKNKDSVDLSNLRFVPMDLDSDSELYCKCYRDCWTEAHGTDDGYSDSPYLSGALKISGKNPMALMKAYSGEKFAGIIELDPDRMEKDGAGWISFCYIVPELRGEGLGVQL